MEGPTIVLAVCRARGITSVSELLTSGLGVKEAG